MPRMRSRIFLAGCLALLTGCLHPTPLRAAEGPAAPKGKAPPRTDRHGDPLPEGALSRLGTVRLRHAGRVSQLAFLGQGKALASLGDDHVYHVREPATGREL